MSPLRDWHHLVVSLVMVLFLSFFIDHDAKEQSLNCNCQLKSWWFMIMIHVLARRRRHPSRRFLSCREYQLVIICFAFLTSTQPNVESRFVSTVLKIQNNDMHVHWRCRNGSRFGDVGGGDKLSICNFSTVGYTRRSLHGKNRNNSEQAPSLQYNDGDLSYYIYPLYIFLCSTSSQCNCLKRLQRGNTRYRNIQWGGLLSNIYIAAEHINGAAF